MIDRRRIEYIIPPDLLARVEAEFGDGDVYEAADYDPSVFHPANSGDTSYRRPNGVLRWWRVFFYESSGHTDELRALTPEEAIRVLDATVQLLDAETWAAIQEKP